MVVRAIAWIQSMLPGGAPVTTTPASTGSGSIVTTPVVPVAN